MSHYDFQNTEPIQFHEDTPIEDQEWPLPYSRPYETVRPECHFDLKKIEYYVPSKSSTPPFTKVDITYDYFEDYDLWNHVEQHPPYPLHVGAGNAIPAPSKFTLINKSYGFNYASKVGVGNSSYTWYSHTDLELEQFRTIYNEIRKPIIEKIKEAKRLQDIDSYCRVIQSLYNKWQGDCNWEDDCGEFNIENFKFEVDADGNGNCLNNVGCGEYEYEDDNGDTQTAPEVCDEDDLGHNPDCCPPCILSCLEEECVQECIKWDDKTGECIEFQCKPCEPIIDDKTGEPTGEEDCPTQKAHSCSKLEHAINSIPLECEKITEVLGSEWSGADLNHYWWEGWLPEGYLDHPQRMDIDPMIHTGGVTFNAPNIQVKNMDIGPPYQSVIGSYRCPAVIDDDDVDDCRPQDGQFCDCTDPNDPSGPPLPDCEQNDNCCCCETCGPDAPQGCVPDVCDEKDPNHNPACCEKEILVAPPNPASHPYFGAFGGFTADTCGCVNDPDKPKYIDNCCFPKIGHRYSEYLEYVASKDARYWNTPFKSILLRKAQMKMLFSTEIQIEVPGDFTVGIGDLIRIALPTAMNIGTSSIEGIDGPQPNRLSGKYLVTRIKHTIDQSSRHKMKLNCVRDSNHMIPQPRYIGSLP